MKSPPRRRRADSELLLMLVEWSVEGTPRAPAVRDLATNESGDPRTRISAAACLVLLNDDKDAVCLQVIRPLLKDNYYGKQARAALEKFEPKGE